jgi:hypothetical protein
MPETAKRIKSARLGYADRKRWLAGDPDVDLVAVEKLGNQYSRGPTELLVLES